ncbi:MAG: hypothetical protein ACRELG_18610, partial [Gemmataceae bacterium]
VPHQYEVKRQLTLEDMRIYGPDGKKMESKDVKKLLTKPTPALLSVDGRPVDRFYLRLARKGTLVLVIPPPTGIPGKDFKIVPADKLPPRPREK